MTVAVDTSVAIPLHSKTAMMAASSFDRTGLEKTGLENMGWPHMALHHYSRK